MRFLIKVVAKSNQTLVGLETTEALDLGAVVEVGCRHGLVEVVSADENSDELEFLSADEAAVDIDEFFT